MSFNFGKYPHNFIKPKTKKNKHTAKKKVVCLYSKWILYRGYNCSTLVILITIVSLPRFLLKRKHSNHCFPNHKVTCSEQHESTISRAKNGCLFGTFEFNTECFLSLWRLISSCYVGFVFFSLFSFLVIILYVFFSTNGFLWSCIIVSLILNKRLLMWMKCL